MTYQGYSRKMNPNCQRCQLVGSNKESIIYEDNKVFAVLAEEPSAFGHIIVMPKEHYPILEQVPDFIVGKAFSVANKISIAIFEALGVTGTNIMVNNGIEAGQDEPHFMVHVIPRREGDGLNFVWPAKQLSQEDMSNAALQLKEFTKEIGMFESEEKIPVEIESKREEVKKEDYRVKHLRRIP